MAVDPDYRILRAGGWKLAVLPERWSELAWQAVRARVEESIPAKHPQTVALSLPGPDEAKSFYLKIFHRPPWPGAVKELSRDSKAFRALKQGAALSREGFHVPLTIAAGERRSWRLLDRSFILTAAVYGRPLPAFLEERFRGPLSKGDLAEKRRGLRKLAAEVGRLHRLGFVHGDLVPSNILVAGAKAGGVEFYFMDNDRTRRYPRRLTALLRRRNLVQLNRFPLAGISLQDRMRFVRQYLSIESWARRDRRLLAWLERKTRARRKECDGASDPASFRRLMRWKNGISEAGR